LRGGAQIRAGKEIMNAAKRSIPFKSRDILIAAAILLAFAPQQRAYASNECPIVDNHASQLSGSTSGSVTIANNTASGTDTASLSGSSVACPIGQPGGPTPPAAYPTVFYSDGSDQITVTSQIPPTSTLIESSVTLLRVYSSGNLITTMGQLYDDGTHGDRQAGDGQYTGQFTFDDLYKGKVYLAVLANYSGSPSCRQSLNNERPLLAAGQPSSQAEREAERNALRAADTFYENEIAKGISTTQAGQDVENYMMAKYGPNGTIQAGLVSSVGVNSSGITIRFSNGHFAVVYFH